MTSYQVVEAYQAVAVYIVLALVEEHHPFQEEADQVEVVVVLVMEVQAFVLVTEVVVQVIVLVMEVVGHLKRGKKVFFQFKNCIFRSFKLFLMQKWIFLPFLK